MDARLNYPRPVKGVGGARRSVAVAVAALVSAGALSACGSGSTTTPSGGVAFPKALLDTHRVALAIEQSILSERHVHAKVTCPKVMPEQQGHNFYCIARVGKTTTPFAVAQTNNNGFVTYKSE